MGPEKPNRHKEGFLKFLLERFRRILGQLDVCHFGILLRIGAPIPGRTPVSGATHWLLGSGTPLPPKGPIDRASQTSTEVLMQNLSPGQGQIPVILEVALNRGEVF